MTSKVIFAAVAVLALAGCGSRSAPLVQRTAERQAPRILGSRVKSYGDIREVKREATAVVVATAESASIETVSGIPFTVTQMHVIDTVSGNVPSAIDLRQVGSTAMRAEGTELVVAGSTYLLLCAHSSSRTACRTASTSRWACRPASTVRSARTTSQRPTTSRRSRSTSSGPTPRRRDGLTG